MRSLLFCLIALFVVVGCAPSVQYDRALIATQEVLNNRGLQVTPSGYEADTMIAVTRVRGDFLSKSRVKVVVKIIENEEGIYEPSVKVLNQLDTSDTSALAHARSQPNNRWVVVGSDPAMEADIFNEIVGLLHGPNPHSGKGWRLQDHRAPKRRTPVKETSDNVDTQATTEFIPETW